MIFLVIEYYIVNINTSFAVVILVILLQRVIDYFIVL